jgi:polysaccharide pyruvyl transferase WcaK-like protein
VIHHVFANRSNIGDWLSAKGIQALLDEPVTEHLCDAPFLADTLAALAALGPHDTVVIGGGGLFMDYFNPFWAALTAIDLAAPLCVWGVGYCDLKLTPSRPPIGLLRAALAKARLCVVRDELTSDALGLNLPTTPCPSLAAVRPAPGGFGLLHVDNYTTAGPEVYEHMEAAGRAFAERTGRPHHNTNNRIEPGRQAEMQQILTRYADCDLVLSSALHGCIIAVAMGRKVLAVSGDRKIEGFMQAAGLGDWVVDLDDVDSTAERLDRLEEQPRQDAFVRAAIEQNRAIAQAVRALAHRQAKRA